jgi:hypothetical protein
LIQLGALTEATAVSRFGVADELKAGIMGSCHRRNAG